MRLYLAGPMTGYEQLNLPAFFEAAEQLRELGYYDVVNPADNTGATAEEAYANAMADPQTWDWYLRKDLRRLLDCDAIVLLPGWRESRGARLEQHVAMSLGMAQFTLNYLLCQAAA